MNKWDNYKEIISAINNEEIIGYDNIRYAIAYGMHLAAKDSPKEDYKKYIADSARKLDGNYSVNVRDIIELQLKEMNKGTSREEMIDLSLKSVDSISNKYIEINKKIGENGFNVLKDLKKPINIFILKGSSSIYSIEKGRTMEIISNCTEGGFGIKIFTNDELVIKEYKGFSESIEYEDIGKMFQDNKIDLVLFDSIFTKTNGDSYGAKGSYAVSLLCSHNSVPLFLTSSKEQITDEDLDHELIPGSLISHIIFEDGICLADNESILNLYPDIKEEPKQRKGDVRGMCSI